MTKITGTLHEDVSIFVTSRRILIKIRNVSDNICRENLNIHFMFRAAAHILCVKEVDRIRAARVSSEIW